MVKCIPIILVLSLASGVAYAQGRMMSAPRVWDFHSTDVIDAADGDDPYDFDLFVVFDQSFEAASIQREYHCSHSTVIAPGPGGTWVSADAGRQSQGDSNCSVDEGKIVAARELDHERIRRRLNIVSRFGIFRDLEFHAFLPIILTDKSTLKMASKSDLPGTYPLQAYCPNDQCSQSTIYRERQSEPGVLTPDIDNSFFMLPNEGPTRGALDNPTLGLWWAPYNHERDDVVATWRLGVDYRLNVVDRALASNQGALTGGVGQGYDEARFSMAFSRTFMQMNPFLEIAYSVSNMIETRSTPFHDYGDGQTLVEPGDRASLRFGSVVSPWEDPDTGRGFHLDFGGSFTYQFEGRDYTPLFDALGASSCNDSPTCDLTKLTYRDPVTNELMRTTGITDVEQFGTLLGWLGFKVSAHRNAFLQARATIAHQTPHFLTFADAGRDNGIQGSGNDARYNQGIIDQSTEDWVSGEENPVFNQHMDLAGSRFRITNHFDFGFFVSGALSF